MAEQNCKQLLIRLPKDRYDKLKRAAFESDRHMTDIANEAIQQWLDQQEQQSK